MAADEMVGAIRRNGETRLRAFQASAKAERMVLERDNYPSGPASAPAPAASATEGGVLSALLNLGYQRAAAEKAWLWSRK
jgi:Holliday junction resolvasome RuvABC DNA-binding subunit